MYPGRWLLLAVHTMNNRERCSSILRADAVKAPGASAKNGRKTRNTFGVSSTCNAANG